MRLKSFEFPFETKYSYLLVADDGTSTRQNWVCCSQAQCKNIDVVCHFLSLANTCLRYCSPAVNLTLSCISQPADCINISKSPGWDHRCSFTFSHIFFLCASSNFSASISLDAGVGWVTPVTFNLLVPKLCALRWTASGRKNRHSCWKNIETFNTLNKTISGMTDWVS